jgi:hypothetical protein
MELIMSFLEECQNALVGQTFNLQPKRELSYSEVRLLSKFIKKSEITEIHINLLISRANSSALRELGQTIKNKGNLKKMELTVRDITYKITAGNPFNPIDVILSSIRTKRKESIQSEYTTLL